MFELKKNYYDDVNILYSFTSEAGDGYCVKRWNRDHVPGETPLKWDGMPSAMWAYLDEDFRPNVEFIKKKREMKEAAMHDRNWTPSLGLNLHIKRKIVTDHALVARFSLIQNDLSNKTLIFIQLEKLKDKINEGTVDLERTHAILETLV